MPKRMPTITGACAALVARSAAVLRPHQTWRKPKVAAHFKPAMAVTRVNFVRIEITINRAFMTPWNNQQDPMWHSNAIEPTILGLESWDSDSWMNDLISVRDVHLIRTYFQLITIFFLVVAYITAHDVG